MQTLFNYLNSVPISPRPILQLRDQLSRKSSMNASTRFIADLIPNGPLKIIKFSKINTGNRK